MAMNAKQVSCKGYFVITFIFYISFKKIVFYITELHYCNAILCLNYPAVNRFIVTMTFSQLLVLAV